MKFLPKNRVLRRFTPFFKWIFPNFPKTRFNGFLSLAPFLIFKITIFFRVLENLKNVFNSWEGSFIENEILKHRYFGYGSGIVTSLIIHENLKNKTFVPCKATCSS